MNLLHSMRGDIGFGTYRLQPAVAERMVEAAILRGGVRRIDTAQLYRNQVEVFRQVREKMGMGPSDVHITTKVARKLIENAERDNRAIETSVLEIIEWKPNLVLLHAPAQNRECSRIAWAQLTRFAPAHPMHPMQIGVSNFDVADLTALEGPQPTVNQVEVSPFHQPTLLLNYCKANGIAIEAHSSLVKGEKFNEPALASTAAELNCSQAAALLSWSIWHDFIPIFSTKSEEHLMTNLQLPGVSQSAIQSLDSLNCGYKTHPQYKYSGECLPRTPRPKQ